VKLPLNISATTRRLLQDIALTCPDMSADEVFEALCKQAGRPPQTITDAELRVAALAWIWGTHRGF